MDENKIYYIGLSDGGEINGVHYTCMSSENEEETKNWCTKVKEKYPNNNITYLKMTDRMKKEFDKIYSQEYKKLFDNNFQKFSDQIFENI